MADDSPHERPSDGRFVEEAILALAGSCAPGKTICPMDAAKAVASARSEEGAAWQSYLGPVRRAAVGLAKEGRLVIYRKGRPADPDNFRGVYRLGLPRFE